MVRQAAARSCPPRASTHRRRLLLLALCALGGAGCYRYEAASTVTPGEAVRVRVSPEEALRLAEVRNSEERLVPGTLLRQDETSLVLVAPVAGGAGRQSRTLEQHIEIRQDAVREIEVRRLDRFRTGLLAGAVVAATAFVVVNQYEGNNNNDDDPGPGQPEMREPVVVSWSRLLQWLTVSGR